ncbi:MAG: DUF4340 domain-containing protein [Cyanobacteria bacterium J06626_14]
MTLFVMKLKAPTVFLVGIAAVLGLVVFAEFQGGDRQAGTDQDAQPLFTFEEDDIQSFMIETPLETLSFERDAEGVWQMQEPEEFTANDASVSFLLNLLATGESDRRLTVSLDELDDFGLDNPQTTIDVVLQDDSTHQLVLGDFDFSQQSLYARVDPDAIDEEGESETVDVALVSTSFDAAVNRSLEEWQQVEPEEPPEETVTPEELEEPSDSDLPEIDGDDSGDASDSESDAVTPNEDDSADVPAESNADETEPNE